MPKKNLFVAEWDKKRIAKKRGPMIFFTRTKMMMQNEYGNENEVNTCIVFNQNLFLPFQHKYDVKWRTKFLRNCLGWIGLSKARKSISREKVRIPSLVRVKWQFPKIAAKNKKVGCILCVKACYCIYFCECNSANREDENPNSKLTSVIAHS